MAQLTQVSLSPRIQTDYGCMVFADKVGKRSDNDTCAFVDLGLTQQRFARSDKRAKLPKWINQYIADTATNLSTDMAIVMTKRFLRSMAQPFEHDQTGVSMWSLEHIEARQKAVREAAEGGRTLGGADEVRNPVADAEAEGWFEGFEDEEIMAIDEATNDQV